MELVLNAISEHL